MVTRVKVKAKRSQCWYQMKGHATKYLHVKHGSNQSFSKEVMANLIKFCQIWTFPKVTGVKVIGVKVIGVKVRYEMKGLVTIIVSTFCSYSSNKSAMTQSTPIRLLCQYK